MSIKGGGQLKTDLGSIRVARSAAGANIIIETEVGEDHYLRQVVKGLDGIRKFRSMVVDACDRAIERLEKELTAE